MPQFQFLNFPAIPKWHSGFITEITLSPKVATTTNNKDEDENEEFVAARARGSSRPTKTRSNFPKEGDTIRGVMGGVSFDAVIIVRARLAQYTLISC